MFHTDDFPFAYQNQRRRVPVRRIIPKNNGVMASSQSKPAIHTSVPSSQDVQADSVIQNSSPVKANGRTEVATDWQAQALRLQAEMDNFRKRQQRRADEAISLEQERLLKLVLPVADNLNRALKEDSDSHESLRQGVELTYRELMRLLESEGVVRLESLGKQFDPNLHEALATVPDENIEANTIVEEIEAGYLFNDKLLRPAKVIVAA